MEKIRILQVGDHNYINEIEMPEYLEWYYGDDLDLDSSITIDILLVIGVPKEKHIDLIGAYAQCYRMFVVEDDDSGFDSELEDLFNRFVANKLSFSELSTFLREQARYYFAGGYGEKYHMDCLKISPQFHGSVVWNGNHHVCLNGDFGADYRQIVSWRNNVPLFEKQTIEFWLEYEKDPNISIKMEIVHFVGGSVSTIQNEWSFSEEELENPVRITNEKNQGTFYVSIKAKGEGELKIIGLHDRYSRGMHGAFYPGGERHVTSRGEEFFTYFEPGDRKPPLCVYFAGYKTQQSFEGVHMMRKMGCPFVLVSDPRLEGGCFYLGDEEYEKKICSVLSYHMNQLGFTSEHLIFSGLSMGSFGAFYYGCDFKPHAILVGKPLASLGNIAANELYLRPGGFPTSVDVLRYMEDDLSEEAVQRLNHRFWDKFDNTLFTDTKFIISYMLEDDYDADAYKRFIDHLHTSGVQLYGKGIHGRHNDDTYGIVQWFQSQYVKLLREDFGRGID